MAEDSTNDIVWFLRTPKEHQELLSPIRPWDNLKVAFEGQDIWVTGFSFLQIESLEVKSNPYIEVFYAEGPKLFPKNSQLPAGNIPSLLWTPIRRAFPVKLPKFNHNYFGIEESLSVNIVAAEGERAPHALLTTLSILGEYLNRAPEVRMKSIEWIVLGNDQALLLGKPLLPIPGKAYWKVEDMLLPVGYDFEFPILASYINQGLNPEYDSWILWQQDTQYLRIPKEKMKKLSVGSYRLTLDTLTKPRI